MNDDIPAPEWITFPSEDELADALAISQRKDYDMTDAHEADPLAGLNPVLVTAVEAFTRSTADAFLKIWTGPRATDTMEKFLAGEVAFVIKLDELMVLAADSIRPRSGDDHGPIGGYL